jgi:putative glycosyltransferase (TIGR04372 family)
LWSLAETLRRALLWGARGIALPLSIVGHFVGFRRLPVLASRIGHMAAEPDCFLKLVALGKIRTRYKHHFIAAPLGTAANRCLMNYWKDYFHVVEEPWQCGLLSLLSAGPLMTESTASYILGIGQPATYGSVNVVWGERPPLLTLRADHRTEGCRFLRSLGMPEGAWFVCVHVRAPGYAPQDDHVHDYRDGDISGFLPAMREIVARGGYCIRMGHPGMKPLDSIAGVIDYAHSSARSDEMDVFLAAACRFFLGDTSGLFLVSTVFGVPCALANMIPITARGFSPKDLNIFKFLKDRQTGRRLSFREMFSSPTARLRNSRAYLDCGIEPVDNTPEEITELVQEMFARLDGSFVETRDDKSRAAAFDGMIRPDDYCYGSGCRVAASFLRRHRNLLPECI